MKNKGLHGAMGIGRSLTVPVAQVPAEEESSMKPLSPCTLPRLFLQFQQLFPPAPDNSPVVDGRAASIPASDPTGGFDQGLHDRADDGIARPARRGVARRRSARRLQRQRAVPRVAPRFDAGDGPGDGSIAHPARTSRRRRVGGDRLDGGDDAGDLSARTSCRRSLASRRQMGWTVCSAKASSIW